MTVAVIGIDDVWDVNVDAAELIDDSGSGIEIDTGVIIEFDIIEIFQSMDRFIDTIKSSMGEFIEFTIHGEGDIKISGSIEEENFVLGGIHYHDEINVGASGKRQGVIAIINTAEINGKRYIERGVSGGFDMFGGDFDFDVCENLELIIDGFVIIF